MSRDVRALDVQDLHRFIREVADVFDAPEWREEPLTGALVAVALRKAAAIGTPRGSRLSTRLRSVIRRTVRRGPHAAPLEERRRTLGDELQPGRPLRAVEEERIATRRA